MKFIIKTVLIVVLAFLMQMFLPWWSIAFAAFFVNIIITSKGFSSFLAGFIALFLLWGVKAYLMDEANEQILSTKMAQLFSVTPTLLLLITGAIGGLVGGFAALTGSNFMALFKKERRKNRNKYYV